MQSATRTYLSLQEIQREELRLLNILADFCTEHQLLFSLDAGTLIGALRHKGFIPWDDDIDVCMPSPCCDVLINHKDEFTPHNARLEGYYGIPLEYSSQLRLTSTKVFVEHKNVLDHGNNNLWIDIFPIEGNVDNEEEGIRICKKATKYRQLLTAGFMKQKVISNKLIAAGVTILRPLLKSYAFRLSCAKKLHALQRSIPYGSTQTVGALCHVSQGEDRMPLVDFENQLQLEFEGRRFPAMGCYDQHLQNWYGDYMQIPPEEQRTTHELKAWRAE